MPFDLMLIHIYLVMKSFLSCAGKTRTLQEQLDMRVSTLILELVSDMTYYLIPFCIDNKQL
jgi:hypothetical protein